MSDVMDSSLNSALKRRRRYIVLGVVLVLLVLIALVVMRGGKPGAGAPAKPANAPRPALTVTVTQPSQANWDEKLVLNGPLAAWQEAVISAEVSGLRIAALTVDVGDQVKRGQPLALLSQDTVLAELRRQEAAVAQAKAQLAEATANADRARKIRDSGALSEQQINQYLVAEETARAALAAANAQLESQNIRLRQTSINAIDDGVISSRTATLGAVVSAGAELFRLVRQGRVEWRAEVSASQLAQVRPGQKATIFLPNGSTVIGVVRMASPTLDPNTRNATVYVDVPSRSGVRPGMYVRGEILTGRRVATTLPQLAVVARDGRNYVFELVGGPGGQQRVRQHLVKTGRREGDAVEILEGLPAGASVVSSGAAFLNDGDIVRVVTASAPARMPQQAVVPIAPVPEAGGLPAPLAADAAPDVPVQSGAR